MREVKWHGLHPDAKKILKHRGIKLNPCFACGRDDGPDHTVYDTFEPAFREEFVLLKFPLTDGDYAIEKVQRVMWSEGPEVFLELRMFHAGEKEPFAMVGWPEETMEHVACLTT